jgi:ribosome recycling factor
MIDGGVHASAVQAIRLELLPYQKSKNLKVPVSKLTPGRRAASMARMVHGALPSRRLLMKT